MALINEILVARYSRGLEKLLGMKGGPPAPQLAPEIVFNLTTLLGAENDALFGLHVYSAGDRQPAVVGQPSHFSFRNPSASGSVARIERILVTTGAANDLKLQVEPGTLDFGTGIANQRWDTRSKTNSSIVFTREGSAAVILGNNGILSIQANTLTNVFSADPTQGLPILPGSRFIIEGSVANDPMVVFILWRERILEASEVQA